MAAGQGHVKPLPEQSFPKNVKLHAIIMGFQLASLPFCLGIEPVKSYSGGGLRAIRRTKGASPQANNSPWAGNWLTKAVKA